MLSILYTCNPILLYRWDICILRSQTIFKTGTLGPDAKATSLYIILCIYSIQSTQYQVYTVHRPTMHPSVLIRYIYQCPINVGWYSATVGWHTFSTPAHNTPLIGGIRDQPSRRRRILLSQCFMEMFTNVQRPFKNTTSICLLANNTTVLSISIQSVFSARCKVSFILTFLVTEIVYCTDTQCPHFSDSPYLGVVNFSPEQQFRDSSSRRCEIYTQAFENNGMIYLAIKVLLIDRQSHLNGCNDAVQGLSFGLITFSTLCFMNFSLQWPHSDTIWINIYYWSQDTKGLFPLCYLLLAFRTSRLLLDLLEIPRILMSVDNNSGTRSRYRSITRCAKRRIRSVHGERHDTTRIPDADWTLYATPVPATSIMIYITA